MTTQPEVIRQSEFLNQLVLDRNTMEELGRVEVLWMYPQAHRVLGFICKSGFLGSQKFAFQLGHIDAIGSNGVLTLAAPQKTTAEKVRQLESLLDHEIWSDEGNRIGKITDCLFHLRTGEITHYLFVSTGWSGIIGEIYQVTPAQILSFGKRRVLVSEAASHRFEVYQAGISQKLTRASESLKEEAVQELNSIAKRAEVTTEQAKEQLQQFSEQARSRAQRLSQQFRQKAQVLNEQVKEKTQTLLEQAKEKSQLLVDQVEERIETLTDQAEDLFDDVRTDLPYSRRAEPFTESEDEDDELWMIEEPPRSSQPAVAQPPSTEVPSGEDEDDDLWTEDDDDLWGIEEPPRSAEPVIPSPAPSAEKAAPKRDEDDDDEPWI